MVANVAAGGLSNAHRLPSPPTSPRGLPTSDVDPFSVEFFENPHRIHDELREAGPVVWLNAWNCCAVARHAEVYAVLNDWETFCSSRGVGMSDFAKEKPWRPPSLVLETDPPEHDRARGVLNKVLSPAVVRGLKEAFAAKADALAAELVRRGSFDAVSDLAEAFPLSVFPQAVGLKQEGREHLLAYAGLAFNAFGPPNELRRKALETAGPHIAWVTEQCRRENLEPGGFGAQIHQAAARGEGITADEALLLVRSLLTAGLDTTVNGIGAAVYCLARFPDEFAKLRAEPGLARQAFEEAIRFESPVQTFFRTTTRAVEIGGVEMGGGEKVLMFLGAANRDPRHWPDPDRYDINRRAAGHVGFGWGVHNCVGQMLARLEGEVMLAALARHAASLAISGPVVRRYNNTLRGLENLPLRVVKA
jgi:cytochrome P450